MMRILHVIGAMDRGGAETMIMNLYRSIDRSRVQFDFLVHEQRVCDYDEEIQDLGGAVYRALPRFTLLNYPTYRRRCHAFFSGHPEHAIVHGHIASSAAVYLREAKRQGRVTIAHSHAQNYPVSVPELGFRALAYPVRFIADQFLACSIEAGRDRFGKAVVEGDRFHVVKNAIDVDRYANDPVSHERAKRALGYEGAPLIGHVGRFDPIKNHPYLIEVFSEVKRRIPDAKLLLVGRGPSEEEVRQAVREARLEDDVVFFGVTDQVADVLKALDVFVFPSFSEGLSMAAVEAQAAGVPCVLSTGVPELAVIAPQHVVRLPLDAGSGVWADAVEQAICDGAGRSEGAVAARSNGYDISGTSGWLGAYYGELLEDKARGA
ncbi:glycosyltransferase family 1 protein [Eggerthella lenta]|uniref:Glycosyltransferase family 1 protein n=1 Tax=Eggerthella lenta TaxID=84112 RepID=A0A5C5BTY2_EGGLN|nr:glycosyltransferase family 1 protein [Eggerthella lenta]